MPSKLYIDRTQLNVAFCNPQQSGETVQVDTSFRGIIEAAADVPGNQHTVPAQVQRLEPRRPSEYSESSRPQHQRTSRSQAVIFGCPQSHLKVLIPIPIPSHHGMLRHSLNLRDSPRRTLPSDQPPCASKLFVA